MKKKSKLKLLSYSAIRRTFYYPLGKDSYYYALLGENLNVIAQAAGWSFRLAKKKCIKMYIKSKTRARGFDKEKFLI